MLENAQKFSKMKKTSKYAIECKIKVSPLKCLFHETNYVPTRKPLSNITKKNALRKDIPGPNYNSRVAVADFPSVSSVLHCCLSSIYSHSHFSPSLSYFPFFLFHVI